MVIANNGNVGIGNFLFSDPAQKLTVAGSALANNYFTSSDKRFKKEIKAIPEALKSLEKIQGVSYAFETEKFAERNLSENRSIGLIAQQVQKVYPELVAEDEEGYLSVNYDGLIPVLIEALKEQQTQLDEQKAYFEDKIAQLEKQLDGKAENNQELHAPAKLYQNTPNPFDQITAIKMYLPESVNQATLFIYNMQGQTIKQIKVTQRGETALEIAGNTLSSGMYLYALIADNEEVDVKRMILK